jgi:hypothetical protein
LPGVFRRFTTIPHPSDRKLHPDGIARVVLVLDLRFGERGLLDDRPHDRLRAAIELAAHGELHQLVRDRGFGVEAHGRVGILPVALDAEPHELLALHADPVLGEFAALAAEFVDLDLVLVLALGAVLLLDLPLDRQAVAVPAGHVVGVPARHLVRAGDHVLEDLVERVPDMDVAVRIGRAVVQDKARAALGALTQLFVKADALPALEQLWLLLRQTGAHREIRLRQEQRVAVVRAFGRFFLVGGHQAKVL